MKDYSNYHNLNMNEKISHDGLLILERSLNGFEGYDVLINNSIQSKVLIYQKWDSDSQTKKVIGRIEDIIQGNLLTINELDWLITTFPEDNKIYRKAEIQLCNSTFPIQSNKTKVLLRDENGNPILNAFDEEQYVEQNGIPINIPCVASYTTTSDDTEEPINLPEGQIEILMPYTEHEDIAIGKEFYMYGTKFQIIGIDYTKSINKVGIMIIKGKKA